MRPQNRLPAASGSEKGRRRIGALSTECIPEAVPRHERELSS